VLTKRRHVGERAAPGVQRVSPPSPPPPGTPPGETLVRSATSQCPLAKFLFLKTFNHDKGDIGSDRRWLFPAGAPWQIVQASSDRTSNARGHARFRRSDVEALKVPPWTEPPIDPANPPYWPGFRTELTCGKRARWRFFPIKQRSQVEIMRRGRQNVLQPLSSTFERHATPVRDDSE